jgi:hypothetical protein
MIFMAAILYLALGVTVIQSYSNESNFKKTTCTVRAVDHYSSNVKDDWYRCPWECTYRYTPDGLKTFCSLSEFPCIKIVVDVTTKFGLKSAILHESPEKMQRYSDCSTFYCDRDSVVNERDVIRFRNKYGVVGSKMNCYYDVNSLQSDDYDDDGQEHALLRLTHSEAAYINSLFWPSLLAFCGIVLCVFGGVKRHLEQQSKKKNADNTGKKRLVRSEI